MNRPIIQKFIKPNILLAVMLLLLFMGGWVFNYVSFRDTYTGSVSGIDAFISNAGWHILIIVGITFLNLVIVATINRKYAIIRVRTFIPVFLYALFITTWKRSHGLIYPHIATFLFLISLMLFLSMYKNKNAVVPSFWGSLLIALSGLLNPVYLLVIPVVWIGFAQQECLSVKVWLASVMGVIVPWLFFFSYHLYKGNEILIFKEFWLNLNPLETITSFSPIEKIYIIVLIFIFIISLIGIYSNLLKDSLQTRKRISYFVLNFALLLLLNLFSSDNALAFLPFTAYFIAMLIAHPFSLNQSRFFAVLFFIVCLIHALYMYLNCFVF